MRAHYLGFAAYNAWANRRLYDAAATLSDREYRADKGAFFRSCRMASSLCGALQARLDKVLERSAKAIDRPSSDHVHFPPRSRLEHPVKFGTLVATLRATDTLVAEYLDHVSVVPFGNGVPSQLPAARAKLGSGDS